MEAPHSLACLVGPMPAPSGLQTPVLLGDVVKTQRPEHSLEALFDLKLVWAWTLRACRLHAATDPAVTF